MAKQTTKVDFSDRNLNTALPRPRRKAGANFPYGTNAVDLVERPMPKAAKIAFAFLLGALLIGAVANYEAKPDPYQTIEVNR